MKTPHDQDRPRLGYRVKTVHEGGQNLEVDTTTQDLEDISLKTIN